MPKLTYDTYKETKEYLLWKDLNRVAEEYDISEDSYFTMKDLGGNYWEPFLDRLYKLGVMMKLTKKLREIKMDWIRPLLYFGARSDGKIEFDGRIDTVDRGAVADASVVKLAFRNIINVIRRFPTMNQDNFKDVYKEFKKEMKYFFTKFAKYVKDSFRQMHEHVKLVLKPLLDLRKAGYRLFSLERQEKYYKDLTIFKDKNDLATFIKSSKDFFEMEKFKQSKETDSELFFAFMKKDIKQDNYLYTFSSTIRERPKLETSNAYSTTNNFHNNKIGKNDPIINVSKSMATGNLKNKKNFEQEELRKADEEQKKRNLFLPNIDVLEQKEPTKLKHEAYQLKFEEGIKSILTYLIDKLPKDFPYMIDTHKIFVNIKYIPNGRKVEATNFYLEKLVDQLEILKQKCYEMKLNGLSRVLMPITKNEKIIEVLKKIFDLHVTIDTVMGNFLLHEQYMFIYDKIKFLKNSSVDEQIMKLKNSDFMEDAVPRYVMFLSMCHSVEVLLRMRKYYKEEIGRPFKFEDSYQINKHELNNEENELIYAYEIGEEMQRFMTEEIKEHKSLYEDEVKHFGRFWLMEGFFNKNDKNLWLEAIDILSTVNELVREDIRDSFIYPKEDRNNNNQSGKDNNINNLNDMNSSRGSRPSSKYQPSKKRSNTKLALVRKNTKGKRLDSGKGHHRLTKRKTSRKKTMSQSETAKLPEDLTVFRPPNIWNYPYERLVKLKYEKIIIDCGVFKTDIRNVEPAVCYKDGRIEKFKGLFEKIFLSMRSYWAEKINIWEYFFSKVLNALDITYSSLKEIKEKEEKEKKEKEEMEQKRLEEEKKEKELMEKEKLASETIKLPNQEKENLETKASKNEPTEENQKNENESSKKEEEKKEETKENKNTIKGENKKGKIKLKAGKKNK